VPEIVNPRIEEYLRRLYDSEDPVRREMEALAKERDFPIVGPLVGRHLMLLTRAIKARRIFELGSGYGYSALHFARAAGEGGEVHCTELSGENVALAKGFLSRAGVWERVRYHQEEATAALRRVGGVYDIVYNDIDKHGYPETVDLAFEHLRDGGLFITDNVLWSGRILPGEDDGSKATAGVREFTKRLLAHPGFLTAIDPTRDGVAVALKVQASGRTGRPRGALLPGAPPRPAGIPAPRGPWSRRAARRSRPTPSERGGSS
jgi:predicted O-methyltransferase YrrM